MSSEAQNAIAEAMDKHRVERWSISNADGFRWWTHCVGCGWESESRTSNAEWEELMHADGVAHLSVEVDKALGGLRPEYIARHESGGGTIHGTRVNAEIAMRSYVVFPPGVDDPGSGRLTGIESRWVSGWSEA
ncbi:hypothetical protein SEA_BOBBY_68 [Mycobacterium phage Bobby]|nr:hypothetical protein SEA_BOBBY_68 [Mycobacterium phage Bobby]